MKRVYAVWFAKKIAPVLLLEIPIFLVIALHEIAREFFVAKVIENFLLSANYGGLAGVWNFGVSAAQNAPFLPVLIIGFSLAFCAVLGYKIFRNFLNIELVKI